MTLYEKLRRRMIAAMVLLLTGMRDVRGVTETDRARALRQSRDRAKQRREDLLAHDRKVAKALLESGLLWGHNRYEVEA